MGLGVRGRRSTWLAAGCLAWRLALPGTAGAQTDASPPPGSFDGAATVAIQGIDQAAARDKALDAAFHEVVEGAVVAAIGTDEASSRAASIERSILSRSRSFVLGYQVSDEGADGGSYHVTLRARVATNALRKALDALRAPPSPAPGSPDGSVPAAQPGLVGVETSVDVVISGALTGSRYKAIEAFLERQVPGVRSVAVRSVEPGVVTLDVIGSFPPPGLGGYLSSAELAGFRLTANPSPVGSTIDVVVQNLDAPR